MGSTSFRSASAAAAPALAGAALPRELWHADMQVLAGDSLHLVFFRGESHLFLHAC